MPAIMTIKNTNDLIRLTKTLQNLFYTKIERGFDSYKNPIFRLKESPGKKLLIIVVLHSSKLIPTETEVNYYVQPGRTDSKN